jgi:hypothetical protein
LERKQAGFGIFVSSGLVNFKNEGEYRDIRNGFDFLPIVPAIGGVAGRGRAREAQSLPRPGLLGKTRAGIWRSERKAAGFGFGARRSWLEPYRQDVYRGWIG